MGNELTMEQVEPKPALPPHLVLKEYLDTNGIRYTHISNHLGFYRTWCTNLFNGRFALTKENQEKIEALLNIKL